METWRGSLEQQQEIWEERATLQEQEEEKGEAAPLETWDEIAEAQAQELHREEEQETSEEGEQVNWEKQQAIEALRDSWQESSLACVWEEEEKH